MAQVPCGQCGINECGHFRCLALCTSCFCKDLLRLLDEVEPLHAESRQYQGCLEGVYFRLVSASDTLVNGQQPMEARLSRLLATTLAGRLRDTPNVPTEMTSHR